MCITDDRKSDWDGDAQGESKSGPTSIPLHPSLWIENNASPDMIVLKDSWPLASHANESTIFGKVQGQFGIPDILAAWEVSRPDGSRDDTDSMLPKNLESYNLYDRKGSEVWKPENRIHMRIAFTTIGRDLREADSPRHMVEGILHGMLGKLISSLYLSLTCPCFQVISISGRLGTCIEM